MVIGEEIISKGSFLGYEEDWHETVKEFKDGRLSHGYSFKSALKSAEKLTRVCEVNKDSIHEAFHAALDGDESDKDKALDTNWVPSDCKINENKNIKTKDQAGSNALGTGTLLTEFYEWLTGVDGGYRSEKMVQQYKNQVSSIIRRLQMNETIVRQDNPNHPCTCSYFPGNKE